MTKKTLEKNHQLRKTPTKRSTDYWTAEEARGKLIDYKRICKFIMKLVPKKHW